MQMNLLIAQVLIIFAVLNIIIGIFLFRRPDSAIQIQKNFYLLINWRIEPVSIKKEIRNMKIMGLFLIVISIITIIFVLRWRWLS